MTNYERWLLYTKNLPSPNSYINFGFYFIISAALQRRVWFYSESMPVFPNQYIVFVGPPAVGKGLVLGAISHFLKFHKDSSRPTIKTSTGTEHQLLFPSGADNITFEQLLAKLASSGRVIMRPDKSFYTHTSIWFVLEELSSLFQRKTEDVVKFLVNAYDCKEYDKETKHQGQDLIRRLCLNFIAGTQIDFLKEAHKHKIFGQGFSSRTLMLFENNRRFDAFHISGETDEQKAAKTAILDWLRKLAGVYGPITYGPAVTEWLDAWYVNDHVKKELGAGDRMRDYLGRKKVILLKLAAAIHFAESLTMEIELPCVVRAVELLDSVEDNMRAGLALSGSNVLHIPSRKILAYIKQRKEVSKAEIVLEFSSDLNIEEIEMCLKELEIGCGLKHKVDKTRKTIYYL